MDRYTNLDANESAFFDRQLEHIKSKVYPVLYPELKSRQFIPVDSSAGDGVDEITFRMEDQVGAAKLITDYANDLPRADVFGTEQTQKVRDLGVSFGYNIREIRSAIRAGTDLVSRKGAAARKAAELKLDAIGATGDTVGGLKGFLNHTDISAASVANPGGGTAWSTKTPDQILTDMNEAVTAIRDATNGVHSPTTLLVPEAQYTLIAQKRLTDLNVTILQFFLASNPFIKEVMPWYRLKTAGSGSVARMVAYDRSPEVLTLEIPGEFEMMEAQPRGLELVVPCRLVTAGVILYRPKACIFRDGI